MLPRRCAGHAGLRRNQTSALPSVWYGCSGRTRGTGGVATISRDSSRLQGRLGRDHRHCLVFSYLGPDPRAKGRGSTDTGDSVFVDAERYRVYSR